jgi:predicted ATPase
MITALELENFKGVSNRTRIELGPLTLLFGANNAGKSTILQALLFLLEALESGRADIDRTELGGTQVNLGGFQRIVHRHELNRDIVIRVEFDTPGSLNCFDRALADVVFDDLDDDMERAWVEIKCSWWSTTAGEAPYITSFAVGQWEQPEPILIVRLERERLLVPGEPYFVEVNLLHPALSLPEPTALVEELGWRSFATTQDIEHFQFPVSRSDRLSAVPSLVEPIRLITAEPDPDSSSHTPTDTTDAVRSEIQTLIEMLAIGVPRQLVEQLRAATYIGSLRAVPDRAHLYSGRIDRLEWADGLAGWEALLSDREDLVERVNGWLTRLGAICQIRVQRLYEPEASAEQISAEHSDVMARRLLLDVGTGTAVLPREVGAGISQLVPIIVAAVCQPGNRFLMTEQPELHVHPALQVELGDLFIEASKDRQLLIETHSEHLILRLLKRIRQTHENELPFKALPLKPADLTVLYVQSTAQGSEVVPIPVTDEGDFAVRWPQGFFAERVEELL